MSQPLTTSSDATPYRQQLKADAKRKKIEAKEARSSAFELNTRTDGSTWELTVGIEIHAQLNTQSKLFSSASTSSSDEPNSNIALCDVAYPGAQPIFQAAALLPALRAAIALNCDIQRRSSFDRKHYFYPDQPAGYQITQFYEPFAKQGQLTLSPGDGIAPEDGESITIGIKQIQLEQDTGKSLAQSDSETLIDFNRVSHPLIEVISLPQIHHPSTAAAYVRKVQSILKAVGAVTAGMEMGGLRADVNVSVRRRGQSSSSPDQSYAGIHGLGQRTEIKNLSSFKAVEDAIRAEKHRQISILEDGGVIEGETRGWTIGGKETHKLREKEGEVDYRYMPDPDIMPLTIPTKLIEQVKASLPLLPDDTVSILVQHHGLTEKDAKTIMSFDDGDRLEYFYETLASLEELSPSDADPKVAGTLVGNFVLHEFGALLTKHDITWTPDVLPASKMAEIVELVLSKRITSGAAKQLLAEALVDKSSFIHDIASAHNLLITELTDAEYHEVVSQVLEDNPDFTKSITAKNADKKVKALVGMAMGHFKKTGRHGSVEPHRLQWIIREQIDLSINT